MTKKQLLNQLKYRLTELENLDDNKKLDNNEFGSIFESPIDHEDYSLETSDQLYYLIRDLKLYFKNQKECKCQQNNM